MKHLLAASVMLVAALLLTAAPAQAVSGPTADLWSKWTAHDETSKLSIRHGAWDKFLARYVVQGEDGINRVDYYRIVGDRQSPFGYISALANARVSALTRDEQLAYWINLYNALTVLVVTGEKPVDSIRDIPSGGLFSALFGGGPWDRELIEIEGSRLTLNDIEHRILRPIWQDPRIHYAVNCAALGCPDLRAEAWQAENIDAQLDAAARAYVNHPRGARFTDDGLVVSKIYEWYVADFGGTEAGVIAHLRRYAEGALAERLAVTDSIAGYEYDWSLNGVVR